MQVRGTGEWTEYSVRLTFNREARQFVAGFLLVGTGTVWADDFQLLVEGRPIAEAPGRAPTVLETDREFDATSRVSVGALSEMQVKNLTMLARVWGFLEYHHPAVVTGRHHWDYELFRVMPKVLEAAEPAEASRAIGEWIAKLGPVPDCTSCATLNRTSSASAAGR
jgi:hypothetical protein